MFALTGSARATSEGATRLVSRTVTVFANTPVQPTPH